MINNSLRVTRLRKKILFQARYRATKELNFIIKNFIEHFLEELNEELLIDLDILLSHYSDQELYEFFIKNKKLPLWLNNNLVHKISTFVQNLSKYKFKD